MNQTLLAASANATHVSRFIDRLAKIVDNGMHLFKDVVHLFKYYGLKIKVIAASILYPDLFVASSKTSAHITTIPCKVLAQMIQRPHKDIGIVRFFQ